MQKRTIKKLLIIALIFTMTFANPMFVTKSLATSIFDFVNKSDTGSKNIEFNAFWNSENMEMGSAIFDVNNKDIKMQLKVNVKDAGYLKNAKIALIGSDENTGLNFKLKNVKDSKRKENCAGIREQREKKDQGACAGHALRHRVGDVLSCQQKPDGKAFAGTADVSALRDRVACHMDSASKVVFSLAGGRAVHPAFAVGQHPVLSGREYGAAPDAGQQCQHSGFRGAAGLAGFASAV